MSSEIDKTAKKERIYEAAIGLFEERGYENVTLADIASEAHVSTRTLYRYYPKKSSFHEDFIRHGIDELRMFYIALPPGMPPMDRIVEMMCFDYFTMFKQFKLNFLIHPKRNDEGLEARYEMKALQISEGLYYRALKDAQAELDIAPSIQTNIAAEIVFAIYRHGSDIIRFKFRGSENPQIVKAYFRDRMTLTWPSIEETLFHTPVNEKRRS